MKALRCVLPRSSVNGWTPDGRMAGWQRGEADHRLLVALVGPTYYCGTDYLRGRHSRSNFDTYLLLHIDIVMLVVSSSSSSNSGGCSSLAKEQRSKGANEPRILGYDCLFYGKRQVTLSFFWLRYEKLQPKYIYHPPFHSRFFAQIVVSLHLLFHISSRFNQKLIYT